MASVDFLGNPMGLINDVSSGLEGLVKRGNVGGLFMNVAHGVSDSAAKVSTRPYLFITYQFCSQLAKLSACTSNAKVIPVSFKLEFVCID